MSKSLTRKSHPKTSREAAASLNLSKADSRATKLVTKYPGRTAAELDRLGRCKERQVGKRLGGLANRGVISRGDARICRVRKRRCMTWYVGGESCQP